MTTYAAAKDAVTAYAAAEERADIITAALATATSAAVRATLLYDLAVQVAVQAETSNTAFGARPLDGEDGRDLAEALTFEAVLISAVAAAEHAQATGTPRVKARVPAIEQAAAPVLDALATATGRIHRSDLLSDLYEAVEPLVGHHAAEGVAALSHHYAPRFERSGWAA